MTAPFHDTAERIRSYGFGLVRRNANTWAVVRRGATVHEADTPEDALAFCVAWSRHVR